MSTALVLGSGGTLHADIAAYTGPIDGVVACNEVGMEWPGQLDAWVSLHCRYFAEKGWRKSRAAKGYPPARRHVGHIEALKGSLGQSRHLTADIEEMDYHFQPGDKSGSSGLFAAKVALVDLGFDRVVLCGIPMTATEHFNGRTTWRDSRGTAEGFRRGWLEVPEEYRARMRSMSGWTRVLLGAPKIEKETA